MPLLAEKKLRDLVTALNDPPPLEQWGQDRRLARPRPQAERHVNQRELLFELDTAPLALFERHGKDEIFDLISRSSSNLLRRWDG